MNQVHKNEFRTNREYVYSFYRDYNIHFFQCKLQESLNNPTKMNVL